LQLPTGQDSQLHARVAKLADALDLGSCALIGVGVRLPPLAIVRGLLLTAQAGRKTTVSCPRAGAHGFLAEESDRVLPAIPETV
jgi:hypothetical protein